MKFVKTFENFRVNEEVPYNFDAASDMLKVRWTEKEIDDLEKIGATNIKDNTALIDEDDLVVFITKDRSGYKINPNKEIKSFQYGRMGTGEGGLPGVVDKSKKIPTNLVIPNNIEDWGQVLRFLDNIFRKHKFGWDSNYLSK